MRNIYNLDKILGTTTMSQDQTPSNLSTIPDTSQDPATSPNHRDPPPAPEDLPNNPSAAPPDETSIAANNPGSSNTSFSPTIAASLKRPRKEDAAEGTAPDDVPVAKRRARATGNLIYRIVVPSRQIGKVIGKSGHRIQKIREDSKATIKIADAISVKPFQPDEKKVGSGEDQTSETVNCRLNFVLSDIYPPHGPNCIWALMWRRQEERVIIISSEDSDNDFSDAENALHQIVSLILKDDEGNVEASKVGAGHVAANTVRLLIAGSQAGSLIGVSGQNIVNLRNTSGAAITVLSPNQLPPCASAHESDRVVQISGEIPAVLRAVVEIGCQLRDNPTKQVISVNPTNNSGFHRQSQQYADPNSGSCLTLDLMVPENLVGGLIGRFGANISRIRNESGANIKVYGARGEQTLRQIHLSGNAQQVALAKQRVDEYVYTELMRQAGGTGVQFHSDALYQGYAHPHAPLYTTSNPEARLMMPAIPQIYGPPTTSHGHQSYPAPEL